MFVDSHAHLDGERFDGDRDQVLARAREAGLRNIVVIGSGTGPGSLDCAVLLAEKYDELYATIGIHPHEAQLAKDSDFSDIDTVGSAPQSDCLGRNWPRLFLRSFSAPKVSTAGFCAADGTCTVDCWPNRHSQPSFAS